MTIDLKGKNSVVCGSTQGIGRAIAIAMANAGSSVTLIARNENKLIETVKSLNCKAGQKHRYITADFSDTDSLKSSIKTFLQTQPDIQILVNNTGGPPGGEAIKALTEDYEDAFKKHLISSQILTQAFAEGMKEAGYGRIINIISTSVKQPIKGLGVSNTIRGAVASWSKTISAELGKYGITVNNILPGATKTERLKSIIKKKAEDLSLSEKEITADMLKEIPAGRFAEPEEPAGLAVFLASPLAGYINGVSIAVDGGRTGCI
jgi:3-oxoacyl-[acyl-carrier protein] reductase